MIHLLDLRAAPGATGSHTPGERGSTPRPATTLRATRAGCDTRSAPVPSGGTPAGSPSPIGGAARSSALDVSEPDEVPVAGTQAACPRRPRSAEGRMNGAGRVQDPQGGGRFRRALTDALVIAACVALCALAAVSAALLVAALVLRTPAHSRRHR